MVDTALTRIFAILQTHGIVGGSPAPSAPLDAPLPVPTLEEAEALIGMLCKWAPERIVFYDTECIYEPDAYAELVQEHAAATRGEWRPQAVRSEFVAEADPGSYRARISFEQQGQQVTWEFEQSTKWVRGEFWNAIAAFAADHLTGTFVHLPTFDQCACFLYAPHAAAAELAPYLEMCERIGREAWREAWRACQGWG